MIGKEHFDAVVANPGDATVLNTARHLLQSQRILAAVPDGLALVDFDLKIRWANSAFPVVVRWRGRRPRLLRRPRLARTRSVPTSVPSTPP